MDTRHNGPHENVKGRQPGAPYNANYPIVHTRHNGPHENVKGRQPWAPYSANYPALSALTPPRSHGLIDSLTDCQLSVIVCLYSFDCVYMLNFNAA